MLGVDSNIVGHTSFCPASGLKNSNLVASAVEVNSERLVALDPSIILCSSLTKKRTVESLRDIGLNVKSLLVPESYKDICEQFVKIGSFVNKEQIADSIIEVADNRIEKVKNDIPNGYTPDVFIEIGAKPLFAATSESFLHDLIVFTGANNVAADNSSGSITRESVLSSNPDFIFIVTMGIVGENEKKTWMQYKNLNASRNNNIFVIDSDKTCSPTPISFAVVLEEVAGIIYGNE